MTDSPAAPALLFIEHVLWTPAGAWSSAVDHLAARFARSSPLDPAAVRDAGELHDQLVFLDEWATAANVDLDRELGRYLDEHLSMHVRPDPATTRAVRALASTRPVHAVSALPPRAGESILRHAGCMRSIATVHPNVHDAAGLDELIREIGPSLLYAATPTPLPAGTSATLLLQPSP